jgi:ribosomal protein S18 acetylase RimI-like enzyme
MEEQDIELMKKIISIVDKEDMLVLDDWVSKMDKQNRIVSKNFDFPSYHLNAYIRYGKNMYGTEFLPTLVISSIEVDSDARGKGYGSKFIDDFEKIAFQHNRNVFVELVHSKVLAEILKKKNYILDDGMLYERCWWKFI